MGPTETDECDRPAVEYPRFDHGEDLLVLIRSDDAIEFRLDAPDAYVRADNAVPVEDVI